MALNLSLFISLSPGFFGDKDTEIEKIIRESRENSKKLDNISSQMLTDYPELPGKVKMLLEGYPSLDSERIDALSKIVYSNEGYKKALISVQLIFLMWSCLSILYFCKRNQN